MIGNDVQTEGWPDSPSPGNVEHLKGLVVAAMCCIPIGVPERLQEWRDVSQGLTVQPDGLSEFVDELLTGANEQSTDALWSKVRNAQYGYGVRCGAAAALLQRALRPLDIAQLQAWLAAAIVIDESWVYQDIFNAHLARSFARQWQRILQHPFQLSNPRTSVPLIQGAIAKAKEGRGTLRSFLTEVASAVGWPIGTLSNYLK